jgi:hypothetical protein
MSDSDDLCNITNLETLAYSSDNPYTFSMGWAMPPIYGWPGAI